MTKRKNCAKCYTKCGIKFTPENGKIRICPRCQWTAQTKACHNCGKEFLMKSPASNHCSRSCITTTRNKKWAVGGEAWREKWGEEADTKMEEYRMKLSAATSGEKNPIYGRQRSAATKAKLSIWHKRPNSERFGSEKAKEISKKISLQTTGEKNPAYGKIYARGGRSVKGYYKEKFFRSLLEYSFMKYVESTDVSLDNLDYENFLIPWVNELGVNRTYRPDFCHFASKTVYEVKQSYMVQYCKLKHEAASLYLKERGLTFKVITEKDFAKIRFEDALKDECVKWDERTFKYFEKLSK